MERGYTITLTDREYDALKTRVIVLEAALRRIGKGHNVDPPWERHLYSRSCDACNAQEIANVALELCCPWCSGPHVGTDCRAKRAQSDAALAPKEPTPQDRGGEHE